MVKSITKSEKLIKAINKPGKQVYYSDIPEKLVKKGGKVKDEKHKNHGKRKLFVWKCTIQFGALGVSEFLCKFFANPGGGCRHFLELGQEIGGTLPPRS